MLDILFILFLSLYVTIYCIKGGGSRAGFIIIRSGFFTNILCVIFSLTVDLGSNTFVSYITNTFVIMLFNARQKSNCNCYYKDLFHCKKEIRS
jgi:hypothetical protein